MLKFLVPSEVKVNIKSDDIRLTSKSPTKKTWSSPKNILFYTIVGRTQSHSGPLGEPPKGYIQTIPGNYKSKRLNNIIGVGTVHLKCDCTQGSIVRGILEPNMLSFALD